MRTINKGAHTKKNLENHLMIIVCAFICVCVCVFAINIMQGFIFEVFYSIHNLGYKEILESH